MERDDSSSSALPKYKKMYLFVKWNGCLFFHGDLLPGPSSYLCTVV